MRLIGRSILVLMLLLFLFQVYQRVDSWQGWQKPQSADDELGFDSYRVYWLDDSLIFKLPANTEQVRVMLTSTVSQDSSDFRLGFSARGQDSQVLAQGQRQYDNLSLPPEGERFLGMIQGQPAHYTREFYLDGNKANPLSQLKLWKISGDDVKVALRVAVLERKSDSELAINWQRMRREKRSKLLEGHIYPSDLVKEEHRRAALQYQWLSLGPEGLEGEAYQVTTLFVKNEDEQLPPVQLGELDSADVISKSKVVTLMQRATNPISGASCAQPQDWMELAWVEDDRISVQHFDGAELSIPAQPRLYRLRSSAKCQLSLFDSNGQAVELERQVQRTYVTQRGQPLEFVLTPGENSVQPLKLTARGLNLDSSGEVLWEVEDDNGAALLKGRLQVTKKPDWYERLASNDAQLSARSEVIINAPINAAKIRVYSESQTMLIKLFSRSIHMPWLAGTPKWFTVEPNDFERLKLMDHSKLIYWQKRLEPNDHQTFLSQWQTLTPEPNITSFELFSHDISEAYTPSAYLPFTGGSVLLEGQPGRRFITPSLIYQRSNSDPQQITVQLNDESIQYWLVGSIGKLNLMMVKPGWNEVTIKSNGHIQWFLNHQANNQLEQKGRRLRLVYPLGNNLQFQLDKSEPKEWVSLHYFPATDKAHRLTVTIKYMAKAGTTEAHTVPIRQFNIEPQQEKPLNWLLHQRDSRLWGPVVLGFALESDLQAAKYRITVSSDIADSGYIQASYVKQIPDVLIEHFSERGGDGN